MPKLSCSHRARCTERYCRRADRASQRTAVRLSASTPPISSEIFVAPTHPAKTYFTRVPSYYSSHFSIIESNSGVFATPEDQQDYTILRPSEVLPRPTVRTFQQPRILQILQCRHRLFLSFELDYDFLVASDFRRDLTAPSDFSAVPFAYAALYMPIITDNNEFRLGVGSIGEYSYDLFAASTYEYDPRFSPAPIYELLVIHAPSLYSSSVYDIISMYAYSILPRHSRGFRLNLIIVTSLDPKHGLIANVSALSPTIPFPPVRVPTLLTAVTTVFSTGVGSLPGHSGFSMADWSNTLLAIPFSLASSTVGVRTDTGRCRPR